MTLDTILLVCAVACFVADTFGVSARVNLQSAGLALWLLTTLV
jgi:hypothetical protein